MTVYTRFTGVICFSLIVLLAGSFPAAAADTAASDTLGGVIDSVKNSLKDFPNLLSAFAYLTGLFFTITGVFKFKDHVDSPPNHPLSAGVKRFVAGGAFFSGPYMGSVLQNTLTGGSGTAVGHTGHNAAPDGGGMDQMIVDFITNVAGPMQSILHLFAYIAGIVLLFVGINRLTKTAQDGPRGPAGFGTLMTFLASGAMFSSASMMGAFSSSLFGDAQVSTFADISDTVLNDPDDQAKVGAVVESLMTFIMIVGYISFIRGWLVLKSFADGNSSVSLAQALTFLFGGALAINLGELINVLQKTVGVSGITFT